MNIDTVFSGQVTLFEYIINNLKTYYSNKYVFNNDIIYQFNGIWSIDENKYLLKNDIDNEINKTWKILGIKCKSIDMDQDETIDKLYNACTKLLLSKTFANDIQKQFLLCITNNNFILDFNTELVGFVDGIYDCKNSEFRDIKLNDYVSKNTGYKFPMTNNNEKQLKKFLKEILPIKKDREWLLKYLSMCLFEKNVNNKLKKMIILLGDNAGISTFVKLIDFTFGQYFNISYALSLIKKNTTDKYNKGIRLSIIPWSNNKIPYRIYSELIENNIGSIILTSSIKITFDKNYEMKYINFPNSFVDNPTKSNEIKRDWRMKELIKDYSPDFMLLLISYYKIVVNDGL